MSAGLKATEACCPSLWKLTQAITAHGRGLEPRRCRELHELSGELMARVSA